MAGLGTELAAMSDSAAGSFSPSPDLTLPRLLRLGLAGIASDFRDRRRDPSLRKRPSLRALDPRLHRPVLVIGAPRSGTTFLAGCIGRMPEISYHFEPRLTKAAARCVYDGSWSERRGAAVFRLSYAALLLAALDGGRRFSEKNPENSFVIPFLAAALPGAQFVHIIRDGRDVAVSHAEQPWLSAASAGAGQRGRGGQLWGPYPAGTARLLSGFLGASAAGHQALQAGLAEARPGSVGRWRATLSEQQVSEVEQETGPLLARLGYA